MAIRFTEFAMKNDKEVSLYVIEDPRLTTYLVRIQHGAKVAVATFANLNSRWRITTKYAPDWIYAFVGLVSKSIEQEIVNTLPLYKPLAAKHQNLIYFNSATMRNGTANYATTSVNIQLGMQI